MKNKKIEHVAGYAAPDISNLSACIEDVRRAAIDGDKGPAEPLDYHQLLGRLISCRAKMPPLYLTAAYEPYLAKLNALGQSLFTEIIIRDSNREGNALLMFDIAQTILQNGENYQTKATDAFQEVVSDLYDGFLSAEDRRNVKKPDYEVIPPLVKWGNPDYGPYTFPIAATASFGLQMATVNLPPANARKGLFAWAALGHETVGHDILSADEGLIEELGRQVEAAIQKNKIGNGLAEYWSTRIDETASDILGLLNIGPAAALGLIGFFRGLNAAYGGNAVLRNGGDEDEYHPSDLIRGYLAAAAIKLMRFKGAATWAGVIEAETNRDLPEMGSTIRLGGIDVDLSEAKRSAEIAAHVLVQGKMVALENHSLGQIQNWYDRDEKIVVQLRKILMSAGPLPKKLASGIYAAHVVAAATTAAAGSGADITLLFERMLTILKNMHDANPCWGPLYIAHPGDMAPHFIYSGYEMPAGGEQ
jgi:hypothetical protein